MNGVRRRRKRDTVTNIYRHCKQFGNCPPDVINKVESSTIADKILKYGSGAVYFGGLGIGTGSRGGGVTIGRPGGGYRPAIPIDTIGPLDTTGATDAIDNVISTTVPPVQPLDPSVIELEEFPTGTGDVLPAPPNMSEDIVLPIPEVKVDNEGGPATLEVPIQHTLIRTKSYNPAFELETNSSGSIGETSAPDSIIVTGGGGQAVGEGQRIPLVQFTRREPFLERVEEETSFFTSTPERVERPITLKPRVRRPLTPPSLYGRRIEQIPVEDPAFLSTPGRLVTFDYVNPAFSEEITEIFEQNVQDFVSAAPNPDFRDIVSLSRPSYARTRGGLVRVSRLGQRGTIQTRSGVTIGSQAHFYHDIPPIGPEEATILNIPGEQSGESSILQPMSEEGFELVNLNQVEDVVPDEDLIDTYSDVANVGEDTILQVQLIDADEGRAISSPIVSQRIVRKPGAFVVDVYPDASYVDVPEAGRGAAGDIIPANTPLITIDAFSSDFYLHPSLLRKRRRKRRKYVFVY